MLQPNKAGHDQKKRLVLFNPDLIFLRSGLKLAEHKPTLRAFLFSIGQT